MVSRDDVKDIVILSYLTEEMLEKLLPYLTIRTIEKREVIFRGGDPADMYYMLKRGKVLLEQRISEKISVSVGAVKPGFSFGWSAMLGGERYFMDAVGAEESEALVISGEALLKLLDSDHSMGYRIMQRLLRVVKRRLDIRTEQFVKVISSHPDIFRLLDPP